MVDKSNKKFWDKFAKLYAPFMRKDKEVYDKVCEYLSPHLNKDMEVLELACGVRPFLSDKFDIKSIRITSYWKTLMRRICLTLKDALNEKEK